MEANVDTTLVLFYLQSDSPRASVHSPAADPDFTFTNVELGLI